MIYGGTKYNVQLGKVRREILGLVKELSKARKTVVMPAKRVDQIAAELKIRFPEQEFDDEHIVAIVIASKCRVVCTYDKGAMKYLRDPDVFRPYAGVKRPSIYSGAKSHSKLCCDKHVVDVCRA